MTYNEAIFEQFQERARKHGVLIKLQEAPEQSHTEITFYFSVEHILTNWSPLNITHIDDLASMLKMDLAAYYHSEDLFRNRLLVKATFVRKGMIPKITAREVEEAAKDCSWSQDRKSRTNVLVYAPELLSEDEAA